MYGTVKLLWYQTTSIERQLFVIKNQLLLQKDVTKPNMEIDILSHFQLPDLPSISQDFNNAQIDERLHLISDEPNLNVGVELMMHAECLNFGILTDDDLEYMLMLDHHLQEDNMGIVEPRETGISSSALPPDFQESFMEGVLIEETRIQQAQSDNRKGLQKDVLIPVEEIESVMDHQPAEDFSTILAFEPKTGLLPAPKRYPSEDLQEDTPTKRRRLEFDDLQSQQPMAVQDVSRLTLEELNAEHNFVVTTQKRKVKKAVDNKIEIETKNYIRWIHDVMAHTKSEVKVQSKIPSAVCLLQAPTTCMQKIDGKTWGNRLQVFFDKCIYAALNVGTEAVTRINADIENSASPEIMRAAQTTNKTIEVAELSAAVADIAIDTEYSKTLERTGIEILEDQPLLSMRPESQERLSDNIHTESMTVKSIESSLNLSQNGKLSKNDLLAMLEVHWHDTDIIKFNEVISPSSYTVLDAACAFKLLLELHSENKVTLKQSEAYEPIWIQKYTY